MLNFNSFNRSGFLPINGRIDNFKIPTLIWVFLENRVLVYKSIRSIILIKIQNIISIKYLSILTPHNLLLFTGQQQLVWFIVTYLNIII
jgi:hypothetical protein